MKVNDVGSNRSVSGPRKKKESSGRGDDFARELKGAAESSESAPIGESSGITATSGIYALQEVPDSTEGRSRGLARLYGDKMLERLDRIQLQILQGAVSKSDLMDVARSLRAERIRCDDPKLNEIIDEIELRAEVEIAKLSR